MYCEVGERFADMLSMLSINISQLSRCINLVIVLIKNVIIHFLQNINFIFRMHCSKRIDCITPVLNAIHDV